MRVLKLGVPGMGSTGLSDDENAAMVGFTVFLSIRGEVEQQLMRRYLDFEDAPPSDAQAEANRLVQKSFAAWSGANTDMQLFVDLPDRPDNVTPEYHQQLCRGAELFVSNKAGCISCHVDYGRSPQYRYDAWGTPNRVRNLTDKERYWAKDPSDTLRIIKYGIPAANMPANPLLSDDELRDLAAFVMELPYPARLPADLPSTEGKTP
jgi:mono/diheme cytochrome c family protein